MNPASAGKLMFEQKSLLKWRKQWKNEQETQTVRDFLLGEDNAEEQTEQSNTPKKTRNRLQNRSARKKRS